jgi:hypothetical protein
MKPVNLPAWRTIRIDMAHIILMHARAELRRNTRKSQFPPNMTAPQIERTIRQAYRNAKRCRKQGARALVRGKWSGLTLDMWVNETTKTIESAYPKW